MRTRKEVIPHACDRDSHPIGIDPGDRRHVLDPPIPEFDESDTNRLELAALGNATATEALALRLPVDDQPSAQRVALNHLRQAGILPRIERLVDELLASARSAAIVSSTLRRNTRRIAHRGAALFDADQI